MDEGERGHVPVSRRRGARGKAAGDDEDPEADEVGWKTAVDAAPWLVGEPAPGKEVPPDEMFEKLKPFKDLVERDIEDEQNEGREA